MVHCHAAHLPLGALLSPCTGCDTGELDELQTEVDAYRVNPLLKVGRLFESFGKSNRK